MKLDFSSGKETVKRESYTPPYSQNDNEYNLQLVEQEKIYLPYGREYANKYNITLVPCMRHALDTRKTGKFVLTFREADIAARKVLPLDSQILISSMVFSPGGLNCQGMICEGIPGTEGNAFELRNQFSKGYNFYKTGKYEKAPEVQRKAADQRMKSLKHWLAELGLPLWPEEIENGIATELLKPEFMTWHQYTEASQKKIFLFDPNASPEFEGEDSDVDTALAGSA